MICFLLLILSFFSLHTLLRGRAFYNLDYYFSFSVDADWKADENDGRWFFTDADWKAKKKVYFVDADWKADLKIYFVDADWKAKWTNDSKMSLMD